MRVLAAVLCFTASVAIAQTSFKIEFYNISMDKAFKEVESRFGLKFSFDPEALKQYSISGTITASSSTELVEKLLRNIPFTYRKSREVYLIIPDAKKSRESYLRGRVYDADNGYPLAFAAIQTSNEDGVVASQNGDFKLNLNEDSLLVTVSYLGYKPRQLWAKPDQDLIVVKLEPNTAELPEFIIGANNTLEQFRPASFSIDPNQIATLPSLGETDIFKSIQLLPGIRSTDESAAGLIIRGSGADQNLVMLDGFTLYHLDHFFGIFSTFNPRTINHVDIYKGGFQPKYGGRVSAVLDAKAKAGNFEKVKGGFSLNTTSFNGFLEVPIANKVSAILGYRRSYYDLIQNNIYESFLNKNRVDILDATYPDFSSGQIKIQPDFKFNDFNAKVRFNPSRDEALDFNLYLSNDEYLGLQEQATDISLFEIKDRADWSNLGFSVNHKKNWAENTFSEISVSFSNYTGSTNLESTEAFDSDIDLSGFDFELRNDTTVLYYDYTKENSISDFSLKWNQEYNSDDKNTWLFGLEINRISTDYSLGYLDLISENFDSDATTSSVFVEHQLHLDKWNFNTGIRFNNYSLTNSLLPEPRLNIAFQPWKNTTLHGSWSVHNQFVSRISISPFGNSDQFYWVLADDDIYPIMNSRHLIAGFKYQKDKWTIDVEGYRKNTSGLLESEFALFSQYNGLDLSEFDDLIFNGTNFSRGVDVFVKRKGKKYISWLSYTLSKSENTFEILNGGNPYPSNFDQTHEINWANTLKFGNWELSTVFIYGSGIPFTPPGEISAQNQILFDINSFNSLRIPEYHRLDVSGKYKRRVGKVWLEGGLTLFNVYDHINVKSRRYAIRFNFNQETGNISSLTAFPVDITLLGFTPNLFLNLNF